MLPLQIPRSIGLSKANLEKYSWRKLICYAIMSEIWDDREKIGYSPSKKGERSRRDGLISCLTKSHSTIRI